MRNNYKIQMKIGMAVLCLSVLIGLANECAGQHMTYSDTQNLEITSQVKNNSDLASYQSKDGTVLHNGDTLIIGRPSTNTNLFTYIYIGKVSIGNALLSPPTQISGSFQAEAVIINRIYVSRNKKNSVLGINLFVSDPKIAVYGSRTIFDYEKAYMLGEVINPRAPMSRDEAIAKLKESKDLLDLGVISQGKYDSIKAKLLPIITN